MVQHIALDTNDRWIKYVLNVKNIVFHMTFGKYLNLGTSEIIQTLENFFCPNLFFSWNLF